MEKNKRQQELLILRSEIDEIDFKIIDLLNERLFKVDQIQQIKTRFGIELKDDQREQAVYLHFELGLTEKSEKLRIDQFVKSMIALNKNLPPI